VLYFSPCLPCTPHTKYCKGNGALGFLGSVIPVRLATYSDGTPPAHSISLLIGTGRSRSVIRSLTARRGNRRSPRAQRLLTTAFTLSRHSSFQILAVSMI
jgi:hypothetical protein